MSVEQNPFVQPATRTPPRVPDAAAPIDLFKDAEAAIAAQQRTTRRQRAQERLAAREHAKSQAWLAERRGEAADAAQLWSVAADGSCAVLGPVAHWLRERGQAVAVPSAALDHAGFVERLDALARFADALAIRAQSAADDAAPDDFATSDARAAHCLALAVEIRQAIWRASLETDKSAAVERGG